MVSLANVQYGLTNDDVATVQQALTNEGFSTFVDGWFGDQTKASYTAFEVSIGYTSGSVLNNPTTGAIPQSSVVFTKNNPNVTGLSAATANANAACDKTGVPRTWVTGVSNGANLLTLIVRESSYNANAVNNTDSNATGAIQADGSRLNCSRGYAQTIPATFAAYHEEGTSNHIYDPVANIAAAINYIRARYTDISNVQQANPNLAPRGY